MDKYQPVIGLEIHVELKTQSKMFCQCAADYFGKPPNSNVCPVCLGLPGALPVPNAKAIEWTIKIGQALDCKINAVSKFDRKHYFYPDLPKGYQISQYDEPIAESGFVEINNKQFRIQRVHLEEDTGKLQHAGRDTLIDFNRSSVPLVEIVTEPDFRNSDDVKAFLEEVQVIIRYLDVSDADMEKGSMRLEPNISVRAITNEKLRITNYELPNYKVEVKNINSFRFVKNAIDYEVNRHIELLEKGETPLQETRGYNDAKGTTYAQRSKEDAHDYRYFPEPDIPPLEFAQEYLKTIKQSLPELPQARMSRYIKEYKLKTQDAFNLTRIIARSEQFDRSLKASTEITDITDLPQKIANVILNKKMPLDASEGFILNLLVKLYRSQVGSLTAREQAIENVIAANEKVAKDYQNGKTNAVMFLIGQVMKELKGKDDAQMVRRDLEKSLRK